MVKRMSSATAFPIVRCSWVDAFSDYEQRPRESALSPTAEEWLIHTTGYLLAQDEAFIYIAHELLEGDQVRGTTTIPVPLIIELKVLAKAR